MRTLICLSLVLSLVGCSSVTIHDTYPHSTDAFTQGLEYYNKSVLLESTGLYSHSSLRKVDIASGKTLSIYRFPDEIFAEGLTYINDEIIVLSWKENSVFYFDENLTLLRTDRYKGEGWGLTDNGTHLSMSNGSAYIQVRDPESFDILNTYLVEIDGEPISRLNELEYVDGDIYANVWQEDIIVQINTDTYNGEIHTVPQLLSPQESASADVLNGIAHYPGQETLLITGKLWPHMYNITLK